MKKLGVFILLFTLAFAKVVIKLDNPKDINEKKIKIFYTYVYSDFYDKGKYLNFIKKNVCASEADAIFVHYLLTKDKDIKELQKEVNSANDTCVPISSLKEPYRTYVLTFFDRYFDFVKNMNLKGNYDYVIDVKKVANNLYEVNMTTIYNVKDKKVYTNVIFKIPVKNQKLSLISGG